MSTLRTKFFNQNYANMHQKKLELYYLIPGRGSLNPLPTPQTPPPTPLFFSSFALGLGVVLNSQALRTFDSGLALDSWALRALDSSVALNFRLENSVPPNKFMDPPLAQRLPSFKIPAYAPALYHVFIVMQADVSNQR